MEGALLYTPRLDSKKKLDFEILVPILGACHPFFPIAHSTSPKHNLLDA